MIFSHIKKMVMKSHNVNVEGITITVPPHWDYNIRRILIDAALIAELKVMQIIHENTAAATYFALDRNDTQRVAFVNVGSYNT